MRPALWLALLPAACGEVDVPPDELELGSLANGCAVLLHLDETAWAGAGSVRDACGGDNPGTPSGGIAPIARGVHGGGGDFNSNGCIEIADAPELRATIAFTMSAWVRPTGLNDSNAYGVISKRVDMNASSAYNLYLWTDDRAFVDIEGNDDRFSSRSQLANGAWTQLTVTYDAARPMTERVRVYVDGVFDLASRETAAMIGASPAPLRIGCMPSPSAGTQQYFQGSLDEVGVWTRVLDDAEIARWFLITKPVPGA